MRTIQYLTLGSSGTIVDVSTGSGWSLDTLDSSNTGRSSNTSVSLGSGATRGTLSECFIRHKVFLIPVDRNRPNQEILIPDWLITSHVT